MQKEKISSPTYIGGQAVIEGVMMRGKKMYALAVRKPNKEIAVVTKDLKPLQDKYKFLKLPIFRGMVAFVDSLVMGMSIMTQSVEIASTEEEAYEPTTKFEKFLDKTFGEKLNDYVMYFSIFIAFLISMGLFMFLPVWISQFTNGFIGDKKWLLGVVEGLVKITIFICYILLISSQKDVRRVFAYHGAEHKTINCLESGDELIVSNVRKHTRVHKRCGTSFLLIVMLMSMIVFFFVRTDIVWLRFVIKILTIPFIAGLSYEVIRWAGRSESFIVKIVSFPGLCMQMLTTAEPEDDQIEVAIAATKEVLRNE